ncbi:MAG: hypothetical protein KC503_06230, partial [Myxococcales bacterium]|nr:hypothetical protein [Myxococcales bacterium]
VGGAALRVAAVATLGRHFVSQTRAHGAESRVRRGVYAHLRHPSELGLVALAVGAGVVAGSAGALCLALGALLPLSLVRMRREERAMLCRS